MTGQRSRQDHQEGQRQTNGKEREREGRQTEIKKTIRKESK